MRNQRQGGYHRTRRRRYSALTWTKALSFLIFLLVTTTEGNYFFDRQSSSDVEDPYGVLGVGHYASPDEIRAAYRAKVCFDIHDFGL